MHPPELRAVKWQDLPEWHRLTWYPEPTPAIGINLHRDAIPKFKGLRYLEYLERASKELSDQNLPPFTSDIEHDFGFGGVMKHVGEEGDWARFRMELPCVREELDTECFFCEGSGKDKYLDGRTCISCGGSGHEYDFHQEDLLPFTATFAFMEPAFSPYDPPQTSARTPQLLTAQILSSLDNWRSGVYGEFSPTLAKWLRSLGQYTEIPEVSTAMMAAHERICHDKPEKSSFRAMVLHPNGYYVADCPGQACGVLTSGHDLDLDEGYEFSCHNVDSPIQSLTLLAGLAALSDTARQALGHGS